MQTINKTVKKLAVTGGREYKDASRVYKEIDEFRKTHIAIDTIVTGDARGTDAIARQYAKDRKLKLIVKEADWSDMSEPCVRKANTQGGFYNALAGFKRNQFVVDDAEAMLSFWDNKSKGTLDVINKAIKKGIEVKKIIVNY